jgi:hypothetical protein
MANDPTGAKAEKARATARRDALALRLQNYVGDNNGRLDLVHQIQREDDIAKRQE